MTKNAKIFLVGEDGKSLKPMTETPYAAETILQELLARYPDLLPGDQITPEAPRCWLLVSREMGVPGDVTEVGRWSLDHLFLDQDGIPTFVECKRISDTRIRREVVAQMLDYAANGTKYWAMDRLRQAAAETAQAQSQSIDELIAQLIGAEEDTEVDDYWDLVETNLKAGQVRLIFVADEIPTELRRLVEFLNEKMRDVEVLAVEVKQFLGENQKAIVPRVIGLTEAVRDSKKTRQMPKLSRTEFLAKCTSELVDFFEGVLDLAKEKGHMVTWGSKSFSVRVWLSKEERFASFVYGYHPNQFQFYFENLPFSPDVASALREELMTFGIFKESGQKTLSADLIDDEMIANARNACTFIFEKIEDMAEKYVL